MAVPLTLQVPDNEFRRWEAEALHFGIPVADWASRAVTLVLDTEIPGTETLARKPKRLSSAVMKCKKCGGPLGGDPPTLRRRYCSDICRVRAWRARRR
jgi:hypothetical protein